MTDKAEKTLIISAFLLLPIGAIGYSMPEPANGEKYLGFIKKGNSKKTFSAIMLAGVITLAYMHIKDIRSRKR